MEEKTMELIYEMFIFTLVVYIVGFVWGYYLGKNRVFIGGI
jgi:hypothetical protein